MKETKTKTLQKEILESIWTTAWRSFADTYRWVYSFVNSDLRHYGLTPPQYTVMRIIGTSASGMLNMSEIGKKMIVTFANVTTVVDNLEKRGYVYRSRDPKDRRCVKVGLTHVGLRTFENIHAAHVQEIENVMKTLDRHELENLMRYTEKLRKRVMP